MRVFNRLVVTILGLVLALLGVVAVVEAVWTWTGSGFVLIPGERWLTTLETTLWSAPLVIAISVAVGTVGLVLVVAEVRPQRRRHAVFAAPGADWLLLRRSTETHLSRRLASEVPVSPIRVRLAPHRTGWRVKVTARAAPSSEAALRAAAQHELQRLHAPAASKVTVITTRERGSS